MSEPTSSRDPLEPPILTDAELKVLSALDDLSYELGYAPTHTQMLERLGWSPTSRGSLNAYLKRLAGHGIVEGASRSLRVIR